MIVYHSFSIHLIIDNFFLNRSLWILVLRVLFWFFFFFLIWWIFIIIVVFIIFYWLVSSFLFVIYLFLWSRSRPFSFLFFWSRSRPWSRSWPFSCLFNLIFSFVICLWFFLWAGRIFLLVRILFSAWGFWSWSRTRLWFRSRPVSATPKMIRIKYDLVYDNGNNSVVRLTIF